jgi:CheY-like chemotaxis protein
MSDTAGSKILLVEDDADTLEALRVLFEHEGYQVVTAADADSGFEAAQAERPDLIVLDIMMPAGTEGFHLVWRLRLKGDEGARDVPIIVVSAVHETMPFKFYPDQTGPVYDSYEYLPVQVFLDKPIQPSRLLSEVERLLAEHESGTED